METTIQSLKRMREETENPQEMENQETPNFTCQICVETKTENKKIKGNDKCFHQICSKCIARYVEIKAEYRVASIKCPHFDCTEFLDPLACKSVIPKELFERWIDLLCEWNIKGLEKCYCPYPDCSELIIHECKGKIKKSECPKCKKLFCFQCKLPGDVCEEMHEKGVTKDQNEILFQELAQSRKWTKCPGCNVHVERTYGCNHVICRCLIHFCYKCGKDFASDCSPCRC